MLQLLNAASDPGATIKMDGHVECHPRVMEGHIGLMTIRAIYSQLKTDIRSQFTAQKIHIMALKLIRIDSMHFEFFSLCRNFKEIRSLWLTY